MADDVTSPRSLDTAAGTESDVAQAPLRIVLVGHVDHGKSTLVGRLLFETGALADGKVAEIEATCRRRNMPFEWAFVTDALQVERDQGVTVEVSHIRLKTPTRPVVLIDAPGHREFIRNMVTGAAASDAALLLVDAAEGAREQTRRHLMLLQLLGLRQIVVAVNKMDLIDYSAERFVAVEHDVRAALAQLGLTPAAVVPVMARDGDNLVKLSATMKWYRGATLLAALDGLPAASESTERPLRMWVQDVYKFERRRIIVGQLASGRLEAGDEVLFLPSNKTARIRTIEEFDPRQGMTSRKEAAAGQSIGVTLADEIFVERGELMCHRDTPAGVVSTFRARVFWLGERPLASRRRLGLRVGTLAAAVEIKSVDRVIDATTLSPRDGDTVERNDVAELTLRTRRALPVDPHDENPLTGRFVLVDGGVIAGGGIVAGAGFEAAQLRAAPRATHVVSVEHHVDANARSTRHGHNGGVIWLTGLSGAGKSTIAMALEQRLFAEGYEIYALDGDNLRHGLNANLGFSPAERAENVRRAGEVAALFADAGTLVVASFISPYRADRERARAAVARLAHSGGFHEIYVRCDLATCERRDPKGQYRKARAGLITDFTGVSAPYEEPEAPELIVDTSNVTAEESIAAVLAYVRRQFPLA